MKQIVITIMLFTLTGVFAQTSKTIRVAQNDVLVVEKLPITMIVNGDTLVLGDIGVQDAGKKVHMMLQKKSDRLMHFSGDESNMRIYSVTEDEDDKGEKRKKIRVRVEDMDAENKPGDDKKVMVWVDDMEDSGIAKCKDGKDIFVHVECMDKDEDDDNVIIHEEHMMDSADTAKIKKRECVIIKKIDGGCEIKKECKIIMTGDDKEISPVIGLGILLKEKSGQVCVHKILEKLAPKDQPFKEGDQILKIEGKEIKSLKDFTKAYNAVGSDKKVKAAVKRQNGSVELVFTKPSEKGKMIYIQTKEK